MKRFIEFAVRLQSGSHSLLLVDVEEVSGVLQFSKEGLCQLHLKGGREFLVAGTARGLNNRLIYAMSEDVKHADDNIVRPTIRFLYDKNKEVDKIFFDQYQFNAFEEIMRDYL